MKFFTYGLALAGFIGLSGCAAIEKRDVVTDEIDLVTNLYNQVLTIDANISKSFILTQHPYPTSTYIRFTDATVAGYNSVTILLNPKVVSTVRSDIEQLTSIINAAAAEAPTLSKRDFTLELDSRQISNTTLDLADILATLLEEVVNTINPLLDNLGLGKPPLSPYHTKNSGDHHADL